MPWLDGVPIDGDPGPLRRTIALLAEQIEAGLHVGAQVWVWLDGRTVADAAIGWTDPDADAGRGRPMTVDAHHVWMSACKPLTTAAIARACSTQRLSLDDAVAKHLPGFEVGGKGAITIRHLLTHTADLGDPPTGWPRATWEQTIERIGAHPLPEASRVGEEACYQMTASWFVLAEIARRCDGADDDEPFPAWLRRTLLEPAGLRDTRMELTGEQVEALGDRLGVLYATRRGARVPVEEALGYGKPGARCSPGATAIGPIRDLGRFYQRWLAALEGEADPAIGLAPDVVRAMSRPARVGLFDRAFQQEMDWALGFVANAAARTGRPHSYGFGAHASPQTFGHGGRETSHGFIDPPRRLIVAWLCNGMPGVKAHDRRNHAINTAIYEDLNLA